MQLTAEEVVHDFLTPHTDLFTQWVHYRLPVERASAVLASDGSVLIDRTAGELGARWSREGYTTLALKLAHEIATGRRDAADARRLYAEAATAFSWAVRRRTPSSCCSSRRQPTRASRDRPESGRRSRTKPSRR